MKRWSTLALRTKATLVTHTASAWWMYRISNLGPTHAEFALMDCPSARITINMDATSPLRYPQTSSASASECAHLLCPRECTHPKHTSVTTTSCMHMSFPRSCTAAIWPKVRIHIVPGTFTDDSAPENGTPFVVSGSGKPLRQFIYSRDLAKLFG